MSTHTEAKIEPAEKAILINSIINYLGEQTKKKNQKLAAENLHDKQTPFDAGALFFELAFMGDAEIRKISGLILS